MSRSLGRRLAAIVGTAALLALVLSPVASADSASPTATSTASGSAAPSRTTFTEGFKQDVDSLNPFVGILASSYEVWGVTYDQLLGYSQKDFWPVPMLAESWHESADHKTWTYKIRSGVKWSDGLASTAASSRRTSVPTSRT